MLERLEDVHDLPKPGLDAGWYGKLAEWTALWQQHLPPGVQIQHPDIQSTFNSAHLVRGNDILTDFYDAPDDLDFLLDLVTDYMIDITRHPKAMISDDEWFHDWGAMWKRCARISNCSMQMIRPEFYLGHVLPRNVRFFDTVGGGRMHYCGITGEVIDEFFAVPSVTGLDVACSHHDFFTICDRAPRRVVILPTGSFGEDSPELQRLLIRGLAGEAKHRHPRDRLAGRRGQGLARAVAAIDALLNGLAPRRGRHAMTGRRRT